MTEAARAACLSQVGGCLELDVLLVDYDGSAVVCHTDRHGVSNVYPV